MRRSFVAALGMLVSILAVVSLTAILMAAQKPGAKAPVKTAPNTTAKPAAAAPRTPWGVPDLQGAWFVLEAVPFERSPANAGKEFLTDAEVAEQDKRKAADPGRNARNDNAAQDVTGAYNAVFNSILKTSKRTSMIIDPPDGRIPQLTAEAQQRGGRGGRGGGLAAPGQGARGGGPNDNPETVAQNARCLGVQMPFLPLNTAFAQGTVMQVVQSPKSVAIYMEDDHAGGGNRVIFLDGRPHMPSSVKSYLGDSRGRWEGDTLVVETTNLASGFRGSNPDTFRMIERFKRVDANNLRREITFDDPKTWTKPWTVMIEMGKTDDRRHMIFDSACHEGNFGMTGMLAGARMEEKAAK